MDLAPWKLEFKPDWGKHFKKFDSSEQKKILKKFGQMEQPLSARGLRSSRYQVEEVGQYRIAFIQDEESRTKKIHFVGNHKQYEKWYKGK
ncbi:MAG: hypothetical protein V1493_04655 [Candidatus Diapherotrites archaeon]